MSDTILEVQNLKKYFKTPEGILHAVDDISFKIERNKTLGVVGESGCGKSTLGRCILRLIEPTAGKVFFDGKDITTMDFGELRKTRKDMQMIFQDPYASLDPRRTVFQTIREPILKNHLCPKNQIEDKVIELMELVGLAERFSNSFPHELDGGRRQRVGIARALAMNPKFIVCDEPVSALDVSIQAQILNLLKQLQKQLNLTYIFVTHDLSVVNYFSDDIIVMYLGQVVEMAPTEELFSHPMHPYTEALLSAIPVPRVNYNRERIILKGEITSPIDPPDECRFAKRCRYACENCRAKGPQLKEVSPGHYVSCFRCEEMSK